MSMMIFLKMHFHNEPKSGNFHDWNLSMGINRNIWESTGIYGNKLEICKIAGTGNLNVVENKILQHNPG